MRPIQNSPIPEARVVKKGEMHDSSYLSTAELMRLFREEDFYIFRRPTGGYWSVLEGDGNDRTY